MSFCFKRKNRLFLFFFLSKLYTYIELQISLSSFLDIIIDIVDNDPFNEQNIQSHGTTVESKTKQNKSSR